MEGKWQRNRRTHVAVKKKNNKEKKKKEEKEKTIQKQKGLPTQSSDLNEGPLGWGFKLQT